MHNFLARLAACLVLLVTLGVFVEGPRAAELVMVERDGCPWCEAFDREIAPVYGKTAEGQRAPLRRIDLNRAPPADLAFVQIERLTPVFILVDGGREIGRIRGYPGPDGFWMQLTVLMDRLPNVPKQNQAALTEQLRVAD
jgi:hypothetical protein